jgi:carbon monoxide dehydrogenase subunit G
MLPAPKRPPMRRPRRRLAWCLGGLFALVAWPATAAERPPSAPVAALAAPSVADADVQVERDGAVFRLDVVMHAPVPQALAYAVLIDFDRMASFIPNLKTSQVLSRQGSLWTVRQTGTARWGLLALDFESVRELVLEPPQSLRARAIGGSFRRMDSRMLLTPEPGGTRLHYHAEGEPGDWFPPLIGPALIRHETAEQFTAMLQEMVRRQ